MSTDGLLDTLADLVRINSVNSFYADGPGEAEIGGWVRRFFERREIEVWEQPALPGRSNVIARLPGRDPTRRVLLEAHLDTVSVAGMTIPPFEPRIDAGKLFGRGACDTKAGLAAMMHAVASLKAQRQQPPCEVWLAAVVDEEHSFRGAARLCQGLTADAAIFAEPTNLRVAIASKGVLRFRIVAQGRAAHSSKPWQGIDAITHMARLLLLIEEYHQGLAERSHPLLGPGTGNVGLIRGGEQVNIVPEHCAIEIDRRLLPGERSDAALDCYQRLIDRLSEQYPTFRAALQPPLILDEAMETPADSRAALVAGAALVELGLDAAPCGVPFGSDASKFSRQGIPSLIFGPGSIDQAHAAVEFVELEQVEVAYEFFRRFLLQFE